MISAVTPNEGKPDSTAIMVPVFLTELMMVSRSRGLMERRLMTSASMPYFFWRASAATRDWPTQREKVTMVRSLPARSILALPICLGN
jgi:hypothetical protein